MCGLCYHFPPTAGDPCEHRATTSLDNNTETWAARHPAQNQSTMHADSAGRVRFSGDMRGMAVVAGTSHGARVENNKFLLVADRHAYALQVVLSGNSMVESCKSR